MFKFTENLRELNPEISSDLNFDQLKSLLDHVDIITSQMAGVSENLLPLKREQYISPRV